MPEAPQSKALARQAERRRRRRSLWTIALAILLSLGVHLALLPMPRRWFFAEGPVVPPPPLMVNLQPPPPRPRPRVRVPVPPPQPQGPVVDAPRTKDTRVPANARFRSAYNTHVAKETVAANPGQGALAAVPTPSMGKGRPHPASRAARKQAAKEKAKATEQKKVARKTEGAKQGSRSAAADKHTLPVNDGSRLLAMNQPKPRQADKPPEQSPAVKPEPVLMPNLDQMANAIGGARADSVPGVQLGTQTWLNSRQFKYATFWNRIRSLAGQAWEPMVRDAIRVNDPHGRHIAGDSRVSVVGVTLDAQGQVDDVRILHSSGSDYLDAAAVGAFREVGRFPNPPPPLVSPDGHIRFEFGFILNFTPPPVAGP